MTNQPAEGTFSRLMATTVPTGEKPREAQEKAARPSVATITRPVLETPQPEKEKKQRTNGKKSATKQTPKSINALQLKQDKFEKYSTYLRPGYKKVLQTIALEQDCKDYEVLDEALTVFFEARKK
jgi:hypothetical protein